VTVTVSGDLQIKNLIPSNFLLKKFAFTGHIKTEKLICKSIAHGQCSKLEARILLAEK